jgi:hypothetical protein
MGIGDTIKSAVDGVRDMLGTTCTLADGTSLGKCGYQEIGSEVARAMIGIGYEDESDPAWAIIETSGNASVIEGDAITVTAQSRTFIVRRVDVTQAGDVIIAKRCICMEKLVQT